MQLVCRQSRGEGKKKPLNRDFVVAWQEFFGWYLRHPSWTVYLYLDGLFLLYLLKRSNAEEHHRLAEL
jgi:hypothetical protein